MRPIIFLIVFTLAGLTILASSLWFPEHYRTTAGVACIITLISAFTINEKKTRGKKST